MAKKQDETMIAKSTLPWVVISVVLLLFILVNRAFEIDLRITPKFGIKEEPSPTPASANTAQGKSIDLDALTAQVVPSEGVKLPIVWGDLGKQMVEAGVIDKDKFRQLFKNNLSDDQEAMLGGQWDGQVVLDQQNSRFVLDLLWGFGLGNKNRILEEGQMADPKYGGPDRFASTGGWTLARGSPMDHFSKYRFVELTPEQQTLVETVSEKIYRPCCGNSTAFPDCNHGMAMLGLLELMAAQGASEEQMYQTALAVNSYWFPQTYTELAVYFKEQGKNWSELDPKVILGKDYSSVRGYRATREKIKSLPPVQKGGGGCGA